MEIVLSQGGREITPVPLDKSPFRIGRTRLNHLPILGKTISRHQCEIVHDNGVYSLRDLSGKGTIVNGKKVKKAKLTNKSVIKIGRYQLRIRDIPAKPETTITAVRGGTEVIKTKGSEDQLLALSGNVGGKLVKVVIEGRTFNIGSDDTNDLVLVGSLNTLSPYTLPISEFQYGMIAQALVVCKAADHRSRSFLH